ncbi:hypothetical protein [Litchfieldella qijiaojingensis]|uniref:hypothetical protein n=1 Tax=Litchfieldella qijiaojingensis TaxID=980347 RepID=UPI0016743627|nr:hypothetical protein [Halomonas qijiaojingensis]
MLQTGNFLGPMDKAQRRTKRSTNDMVKSFKRVGGAVAAMGAAAVAAAAGGLTLMTKTGLQNVDAQAKLARQLDGTIGGLRGLQLAGGDAGVEIGTLNGAMERLSSRLGEAERGEGAAADALDRIGVSASALANMDVDERVATIADRVHELGLSGAQTADLLRDLGIRNTEMVNLLRQGGDPIREARQEIEDYGLAIDAIDASVVEAANDALSRTGLLIEATQNALAVELAPIILEIADRFNDAAREAGGMDNAIRVGVESSLIYIGELSDNIWKMWQLMKRGELIMADIEFASAKFARNAWSYIAPFFDKWGDRINNIIEQMNRIPGFGDIEPITIFSEGDFIAGIERNFERALGRRNLAQIEFDAAMDFTPSKAIEEFLDSVEERRKQIAEAASNNPLIPPSDLDSIEDAEKALKEAAREAEQFASSLSSLVDQLFPVAAAQREYAEQQATLTRAFMEGIPIVGGYAEAMERLAEAQLSTQRPEDIYDFLQPDTDKIKAQFDAMDEFSKNAARGMQSHFADFLFNPFEDGLRGMLEGFGETMQRMVSEAVAADLTRHLFGSTVEGGSGDGWIGTAFNAAASFFGGASFDGGGDTGSGPRSGGLDGKGGFLAMLHPRETVIDHTKPSSGRSGVVQQNTYNFVLSRNPDRRTQKQMALEASAAQRRANARLGS